MPGLKCALTVVIGSGWSYEPKAADLTTSGGIGCTIFRRPLILDFLPLHMPLFRISPNRPTPKTPCEYSDQSLELKRSPSDYQFAVVLALRSSLNASISIRTLGLHSLYQTPPDAKQTGIPTLQSQHPHARTHHTIGLSCECRPSICLSKYWYNTNMVPL
jgi:hypothetical protein